jgi:hypothetical protein
MKGAVPVDLDIQTIQAHMILAYMYASDLIHLPAPLHLINHTPPTPIDMDLCKYKWMVLN